MTTYHLQMVIKIRNVKGLNFIISDLELEWILINDRRNATKLTQPMIQLNLLYNL